MQRYVHLKESTRDQDWELADSLPVPGPGTDFEATVSGLGG